MPLIGYARVSTRDQHPEAQTDALSAAGCEKVFVDHASGILAKRTALDEALGYLRAGDTLVITKLDRLGRSVRNLKALADELQSRQVGLRALSQGIDTTTPGGRLFFHMLAAIAEFEHDLIVERTRRRSRRCPRPGAHGRPEVQDDLDQDCSGPVDVRRGAAHRAADRRHLRGVPADDLPPSRPRIAPPQGSSGHEVSTAS